ncbi:MAG: YhjD/YihY/BrkB family envelope integrity protein [Myxococcota bacterium]
MGALSARAPRPLRRWALRAWGVARDAIAGRRIHVRSGFLALWCLECVLPLLVTAAAALHLVGRQDLLVHAVQQVVDAGVFGGTSEPFARTLSARIAAAHPMVLGLGGAASAVFLGWQLYAAAAFDFDELSASPPGGTWLRHFALFPVFGVWAVLLVVGGNVASGWLLTTHPALTPLAWLGSVLVLGLGIAVFPRRRPRWPAVLAGAAVGGTWLELVKLFFWAYTTSDYGISTLTATYGWFQFVPIAMLWMHLLWFSTLLSVVVAQHVDAPQAVEVWRRPGPPRLPPHRRMADAEVAGLVWEALEDDGEGWVDLHELAATQIPVHLLVDVLSVFQDRGWVEAGRQGGGCSAERRRTREQAARAWRDGRGARGRTATDRRGGMRYSPGGVVPHRRAGWRIPRPVERWTRPHPAPGDQLGRYRLAEQVGAGGLATVYRALDERDAPVAVKVLNPARVLPEEVKRFTREYRALSRMDHDNIVKVYEAGVHQGYPWIAMEYVDGTDLDTEIARWRAQDPKDRWVRIDRILRGLCRGLAYVHDQGLIHRDLKPSNVLLTRRGEPKISDFGVVKADNTQTTQLTMAGRLVGTVAFMAPELITDEGVDRRADLYALGAVLYLMATYHRPIEADSVAGYLARHLTEVPRPIGALDPTVPAVLERICTRLLQKDRAYRYPSAQAVLAALDRPEDPDTPPLRGRDEVMGALNRLLMGVMDGTGATVGLVGPVGSGRTHLLRALEEQATSHGLAVALVDAGPRLLADVALALDLHDADELADLARDEPVVLLVDDLDRAEPTAILTLARAARQRSHEGHSAGSGRGAVLFVFATPDTDGEASALVGEGGAQWEVLEVGAVDAKSTIAMLRDRGATGPVAPTLARRLHADYRGLPGPMMLQLEALVRAGWLVRAGDVLRPARPLEELRRADLPVPEEVQRRIGAELAALEPAARDLCELLAVLDRPAAPALLERCRPHDPDAAKRIDQLVKQRLLLRTTQEGEPEEVWLADPCTARVVRAGLPPGRLRALHAALAEALGARRRRTNALEVARHLTAAGEAASAFPLYVQAAKRAAREGRFAEVLDVCEAAEQVREAGQAALGEAERVRLGGWIDLLRGEALLARRAWDDAVPSLERAVAAAGAQGDPELSARTLGGLGRAHYRAGRFADAEPLLREALQQVTARSPEAPPLRALADIALRAGRLGDAETLWATPCSPPPRPATPTPRRAPGAAWRTCAPSRAGCRRPWRCWPRPTTCSTPTATTASGRGSWPAPSSSRWRLGASAARCTAPRASSTWRGGTAWASGCPRPTPCSPTCCSASARRPRPRTPRSRAWSSPRPPTAPAGTRACAPRACSPTSAAATTRWRRCRPPRRWPRAPSTTRRRSSRR